KISKRRNNPNRYGKICAGRKLGSRICQALQWPTLFNKSLMAVGKSYVRLDWLMIFIFIALVTMGWINIYSASLSDSATGFFDFDQIYGKQMIWIGLSVIIIIFVLAIESIFYERFASFIIIVSLISLLGLYFI